MTRPGSYTRSGLKSGQWGLLASCSSLQIFLPHKADPKGLMTPIPSRSRGVGWGGENRADLEDHGKQELALAWDLWGMLVLSPLDSCPRNPSHHAAKPCRPPPPPDQPDAPTPEASLPCSGRQPCGPRSQRRNSSQPGEEPPQTSLNRARCYLGLSALTSLETSTTRSSLLSPSLSCSRERSQSGGHPHHTPRPSLKQPPLLPAGIRTWGQTPQSMHAPLWPTDISSLLTQPQGPVPGHCAPCPLAASPTPAPLQYFRVPFHLAPSRGFIATIMDEEAS